MVINRDTNGEPMKLGDVIAMSEEIFALCSASRDFKGIITQQHIPQELRNRLSPMEQRKVLGFMRRRQQQPTNK